MNIDAWLAQLAATPLAVAIAQGALAFPVLECVHVLCITVVLGTITVIDLHLLGYRSHRKRIKQLTQDLLPYTWAAFAFAFAAGFMLFISNAPKYAHTWQFQVKMLLILAAAVNMAVFHLTAFRRVTEWEGQVPPPLAARAAGAASLSLWVAVVFLGRWVGFSL